MDIRKSVDIADSEGADLEVVVGLVVEVKVVVEDWGGEVKVVAVA